MTEFSRRGFVQSVIGAGMMTANMGNLSAWAADDPWSHVDPELAAALRKFPDPAVPSTENLAAWRAGDKNSWTSDAPELQPKALTIPGPKGQGDVTILAFDPKPDAKNRPAVIYIHGGGFFSGHADSNLRLAQKAAAATGAFIVSVDYALAPEARFPVALEQCYATLTWLHKNSTRFSIDPARIAVMGDSAGGCHAAMLAIAARDRGEFPLAYQCLIYPVLDDRTGSTEHMPSPIGHFVWTEAANRFAWASLLGVPPGSDKVPPGAVPAREKNLAGLPPTFIGIGSIDLFYVEDLEYAKRLQLAGVDTQLFVVPGAYHGFDVVAQTSRATLQFEAVWQNALRRGLGLA